MKHQLQAIAPDLWEKLQKATGNQLLFAVVAAGYFALRHTDLHGAEIDSVLCCLEYNKPMDQEALDRAVRLAEQFDKEHQQRQREHKPDLARLAFRRSRAATAVYLAVQGTTAGSAAQCLYEAHAAGDDLEGLKGAVLSYLETDF